MTYPDALRYLDSFINYEKQDGYDYRASLGLGRITKLCALLGDPQKAARAVHIAGTKGKGSTAALVCSILRAAGYRTGLYTSPHLVSFRERIRIDGALIGEDDIGRLMDAVKAAADMMPGEGLSYFEICTALAFLYFKERAAAFAVYETGMGGRLDATTVVAPLVTAITPISYDHTDKLGTTLARIAFEKAGIVKEGVPCVIAPQEREAAEEIRKVCRERHARPVVVGRDIRYRERGLVGEKETFSVIARDGSYPDLEMALLGSHQVVNAATAIGVVEELVRQGVAIPGTAVRRGVAAARWEGRLEIAGRKPYIVLDGAQNRASAKALAEAVRRIFAYRRLILILGVSKDKDAAGIVDELVPIADAVVLTRSSMALRALDPAKLGALVGAGKETVVTERVGDALEKARAMAGTEDLILVTGSLFVVGDALRHRNDRKTAT